MRTCHTRQVSTNQMLARVATHLAAPAFARVQLTSAPQQSLRRLMSTCRSDATAYCHLQQDLNAAASAGDTGQSSSRLPAR